MKGTKSHSSAGHKLLLCIRQTCFTGGHNESQREHIHIKVKIQMGKQPAPRLLSHQNLTTAFAPLCVFGFCVTSPVILYSRRLYISKLYTVSQTVVQSLFITASLPTQFLGFLDYLDLYGWWKEGRHYAMFLLNLIQVTESISGSVVPLAMFI